jgi:hypothetical protein
MNERAREGQPSQEQVFLDYVLRLERFRADRRAIRIHISRLRPYNRREHHLRIASSCFDALTKKFDGGLFRMSGDDLVFVSKGAGLADLEAVVQKLRYLFNQDPLVNLADGDQNAFCSWFALETDYGDFRRMAEAYEAEARAQRQLADEPTRTLIEPMDPRRLALVEQAIIAADLSFLIRRQPICFAAPGQPPQPLLQELFVSIDELSRAVMPNIDFRGDRWLFLHLTRMLDQRMLATLMHRDELDPASGFAINLNVATTLSPAFYEFDRAVGAERASAAVIELQMIDIFADPASYMFARDWLKARGYKICLDGVKPLLLPLIDRDWLAVDLVKIDWSPDLAIDLVGESGERLRQAIDVIGRDRVILCHCDNETARSVGESLGITMFQGYHFDGLLRQSASLVERGGIRRAMI